MTQLAAWDGSPLLYEDELYPGKGAAIEADLSGRCVHRNRDRTDRCALRSLED